MNGCVLLLKRKQPDEIRKPTTSKRRNDHCCCSQWPTFLTPQKGKKLLLHCTPLKPPSELKQNNKLQFWFVIAFFKPNNMMQGTVCVGLRRCRHKICINCVCLPAIHNRSLHSITINRERERVGKARKTHTQSATRQSRVLH